MQVYERAQVLPPIGAGLTLTPNGLNSLNAIQPGIVESLIRAGSPMRANMVFEDAYELVECLSVAPNIETALHA